MCVKLYFNNILKEVKGGSSLFYYAFYFGGEVNIPSSCSQNGSCKECIVEIIEGDKLLSMRTLEEKHLPEKFRLACRCRVEALTGTVRCNTLHHGRMKISGGNYALTVSLKTDLPYTRKGNQTFYNGELIADGKNILYGIALDIGTTTVSLRLFNIETGECLNEFSFENPQKIGGTDITSRIFYDSVEPGRQLQKILAGYILSAIRSFSISPNDVFEVVVAANPVMRDLFFGLNVSSLGVSPYKSVTEADYLSGKKNTTSITTKPSEILLPLNAHCRVYGIPLIGSHVGADTTASLLYTGIHHEEKMVVLIDIGTNTEIVMGNSHRLVASSCPAGPAFEGGGISCGMPAFSGAIERVRLNPDGSFSLTVIDDLQPEGICGSGLIDLLGILVKNSFINQNGRFTESAENLPGFKDNALYLCTDAECPVYITEKDISELAKAKGANAAGLSILCRTLNIVFDDIDIIYLAGGFGNYINIESAVNIGLLPDIGCHKFKPIGNASLEGASIVLLDEGKRKEAEEFVKIIEHCRLESDSEFLSYFTEGCQFKPLTIS